MPSRHSRNGRNKQNTHIYQQPTPSSRPSPDVFRPSSLPDDSPGSSGEDVIGPSNSMGKQETSSGNSSDTGEEFSQPASPAQVFQLPNLIDITLESESVPPPSLPTPPLPELSNRSLSHHPQPEAPLSPLWDDSGGPTGHLRSPILSSLAGGQYGFARAPNSPPRSIPSSSPQSSSSPSSPRIAAATISIPSSTPSSLPTSHAMNTNAHDDGEAFSRNRMRTSPRADSIAIESAERAPQSDIAYSDSKRALSGLSDEIDSDSRQTGMEGTIRPSRRVPSGYGYGFPVEDLRIDQGYGHGDHPRIGEPSTRRARAHRSSQHDESTVRGGSALSRAMAHPESGRQAQRIPQYEGLGAGSARTRSSTFPVSINGGPDEGDTIISARWDYGISGRRLLFLSYHPVGLQIWDCTDLGSISEVLNLPSHSVRQLIADDESIPVTAKPGLGENSDDLVVEYTGIISRVAGDSQGSLVGILQVVTPTNDKRDHVDEASDSVLLTAEDEETARDPAADVHCWLLIYSLAEHGVIKRVQLPGISVGGGRFEVGNGFVVVSTTLPPSLHILSSATFEVLHHIPSNDLVPFCHKPHSPLFSHALSASHLSSRRHSFLETTSNIVNGIYNNYNEHFNETYYNNDNNRISVRNNVSSPVDHFSSISPSSPSSTSSGTTWAYPGGASSDTNRHRRASIHGLAYQAVEAPSMVVPELISLPAPIFSVSGRLLAYASLPEGNASPTHNGVQPRTSSTLSSAAVSTASAFGSTLSAQFANLGGSGSATGALGALGGISQADVGNAALKVGGSVLSGMKTLGGFAYKSAMAAATDSGNVNLNQRAATGVGGLANRFFSRSAPAATSSSEEHSRRYSIGSTGIEGYEAGKTVGVGQESDHRPSMPQHTVPVAESGYRVTVLDISSVVADVAVPHASQPDSLKAPSPATVMQFIASKSQPVSNIWFSASGTSLLIAPRDGQSVQVYEIRSDPVSRTTAVDEEYESTSNKSKGSRISPSPSSKLDISPLHVYNLRRGRTPAVIESADWAFDGRWLAIGTRKRTIHVFAVNPYGGPSDVQSHTEGRVRNLSELPAMPSDLQPLVRLRVSKIPTPEQPKVPLVFTFLEPSIEAEYRLPSNLLPPITSPHLSPTNQHSYGSVGSNHTVTSSSPSTRSDPLSPSPRQRFGPNGRPRNYQDVLVFDPTDGVLSLRRITSDVKVKSKEGASILGASFGSVNASRSLPGSNVSTRLSVSASPGTSPMQKVTVGNAQAFEGISELIARENTVASWNLRRGKDWSEKRGNVEAVPVRKGGSTQTKWLAQAELSTHSKSTRILPRSVYLSHQFSFLAFGEDYHALIRRYRFDTAGNRIEVRKGVEVRAYATGNSESFVEGGEFSAMSRERRRLASSFDEPLASAISGGLDYTPSQPVLPMFPNGTPGMNPRSLKNSIPIRTMAGLGDGMSGGIGRFRREINKVRSPKLVPSSGNSPVPLEFDEEDEDFLSRETSHHRNSQSVSPGEGPSDSSDVQSVNRAADDVLVSEGQAIKDSDVDQWPGWVGEDRKAVEEAETFDDISAVGLMDEEIHATKPAHPVMKKNKIKRKRN